MASNNVKKGQSKCDQSSGDGKKTTSRRLFVMRHGERCDYAFGRSWVEKCFDDKGLYHQMDLNLPVDITPRLNHKDYLKDSPLTEIGKFQAKATGEALYRAGINIQHVYASPSTRCIETAQNVIDGMLNDAEICIEPSAFEWLGWYKSGVPQLMTPEHLFDCGFRVNTRHKPLVSFNSMTVNETVPEYYQRCQTLATHVAKEHEKEGGDILLVAHAGSLDAFTRGLRGLPPLCSQEMHHMLGSFTYCCLACLGQDTSTGAWELQPPPVPPLSNFDWTCLL